MLAEQNPPVGPGSVGPSAAPPPLRTVFWGFWPTIGFSTAIAAAGLGAQMLVVFLWALIRAARGGTVTAHHLESNGLLLSAASLVSAPAVVGLACLFASLRRTLSVSEYLGFRKVPLKTVIPWSLGLLALVVGFDTLTHCLGRPIVPEFMQQAYHTAGFLPLLWLALVVAAPVSEEALFRGFLFEGILRSRLGAAGAIALTSLIWAAIHLQYDLYGVATIFVSGLYLGYVRLKTGSLYVTMFLHSLMNLIATLEAACIDRAQGI